jgi:hypothetical protein
MDHRNGSVTLHLQAVTDLLHLNSGRVHGVYMSKVVRIDEEALAIAMNYGETLSKGIRKMDETIRTNERMKQDYTAIERMIRQTIQEELEALARY